jgi:phytoene desaturase
VWDVYRDVGKTTAQLSERDAKAYCDLLEEARRLYEAAAPTFVMGAAPGPPALLRYALRHGLQAHPASTLLQLLARFNPGPELTQFFLRFATYLGANPYRAPAILHNVAWVELGLGVYYPDGGVKGAVRALEALARRLRVTVLVGVAVQRLVVRGDRISEVITDQGSFRAEAVISALDIVRTHELLGRVTPLASREPSLSGFVLLLGVAGETPQLAHHTISFAADYPAEFAAIARGQPPQDPTLYLSLSCKSDTEQAPAGCENWFVMANSPALRPGDDWSATGPAYAEYLQRLLGQRGLAVRERLRFSAHRTPQDLARLGHRGSIYGSAPHSLMTTLRPKQTLPGLRNLVLAGGTVHPGGGIPLALLSGQQAARLVLRCLPGANIGPAGV